MTALLSLRTRGRRTEYTLILLHYTDQAVRPDARSKKTLHFDFGRWNPKQTTGQVEVSIEQPYHMTGYIT